MPQFRLSVKQNRPCRETAQMATVANNHLYLLLAGRTGGHLAVILQSGAQRASLFIKQYPTSRRKEGVQPSCTRRAAELFLLNLAGAGSPELQLGHCRGRISRRACQPRRCSTPTNVAKQSPIAVPLADKRQRDAARLKKTTSLHRIPEVGNSPRGRH